MSSNLYMFCFGFNIIWLGDPFLLPCLQGLIFPSTSSSLFVKLSSELLNSCPEFFHFDSFIHFPKEYCNSDDVFRDMLSWLFKFVLRHL